MIKVLVVGNSHSDTDLLDRILRADPGLEIIGRARTTQAAPGMTASLSPNVVVFDLHLPGADEVSAIQAIMSATPTPVVVVAGSSSAEVEAGFDALAAGALSVERRPPDELHPGSEAAALALISAVKAMAEVRVVRRRPLKTGKRDPEPKGHRQARIVALGASTGGPAALRDVLAELPANYSLPLVIVQHIAPGFSQDFVEWLSSASGFPVSLARHGDALMPSKAYLAPDDLHLEVTSRGIISLTRQPAEHGMRPAVSVLFRSVCKQFGSNAVAVLLSGMGKDGALELKALKDAGATTIVQDKESSVVHGMPGEAIRLDAAQLILKPPEIGRALKSIPFLTGKTLPEALVMRGE